MVKFASVADVATRSVREKAIHIREGKCPSRITGVRPYPTAAEASIRVGSFHAQLLSGFRHASIVFSPKRRSDLVWTSLGIAVVVEIGWTLSLKWAATRGGGDPGNKLRAAAPRFGVAVRGIVDQVGRS